MKSFSTDEAFKRPCHLMSSQMRLRFKCFRAFGAFKGPFNYVSPLMSSQVRFFFIRFGTFGAFKRLFILVGAFTNICFLADVAADMLLQVMSRLKCQYTGGTLEAICVHVYILVTSEAFSPQKGFTTNVTLEGLLVCVDLFVGKQVIFSQKYF